MGVVLHKDSKWYQQWKDFKDNNVVFNSEDYLSLGSHQLTVTNVTFVISELIPDELIGSRTDLINVGLTPCLQSCEPLALCTVGPPCPSRGQRYPPFLFFAGFFEMKMKYDESDNTLIRASRAVTDKMTDLIGESLLTDQRRAGVMLSL